VQKVTVAKLCEEVVEPLNPVYHLARRRLRNQGRCYPPQAFARTANKNFGPNLQLLQGITMDLPGERILLSSLNPLDYEALGSENPATSQATGGSDSPTGLKSPEEPKRTPFLPLVANGIVQQSKGAAPTAPHHQPFVATASTASANPFGRSAFRSTLFGFKVREPPQPTKDFSCLKRKLWL
jgi:hypothetical protein